MRAAYDSAFEGDAWQFQPRTHALVVGQPRQLLALWLGENLTVRLALESTHEETCRILRIP